MADVEAPRFAVGQRVRVTARTMVNRVGEVLADLGGDTVRVSVENLGTFDLAAGMLAPVQVGFVTDDEIAKRLQLLEDKLLTAQAAIPGMVREVQALRAELAR